MADSAQENNVLCRKLGLFPAEGALFCDEFDRTVEKRTVSRRLFSADTLQTACGWRAFPR